LLGKDWVLLTFAMAKRHPEPFDVMLSEAPPLASLASGGKHLRVNAVKDLFLSGFFVLHCLRQRGLRMTG